MKNKFAWEIRQDIAKGELLPVDIVRYFVDRCRKYSSRLNVFNMNFFDGALEKAIELQTSDGFESAKRDCVQFPIFGLPYVEKDLVERVGVPCTLGAQGLAGYVPSASHPAISALDSAGGVSLGRTTTSEFGLSATSISSFISPEFAKNFKEEIKNAYEKAAGPLPQGSDPSFSFTLNPNNILTESAGSSAGSAAAVAAGLVPFAHGSDGGGSIRTPAATCGIVGFKPGRGRLWGAMGGLHNVSALATQGTLSRCVLDAALLFDALMRPGHELPSAFATGAPIAPVSSYFESTRAGVSGKLRIAFSLWNPFSEMVDVHLDQNIRESMESVLDLLSNLGHKVTGGQGHGDALMTPGLRDGSRLADAFFTRWCVGAMRQKTPYALGEGDMLPLTRYLMEEGKKIDTGSLWDALLTLIEFERELVAEFEKFDVCITPATASLPVGVDAYVGKSPRGNYLLQCAYNPYASFVNVAGLPAIVIPVGVREEEGSVRFDGTPAQTYFSIQIIGAPGREDLVLKLAYELEQSLRG